MEAGALACFDKANLLADARLFMRVLKKAARTKSILARSGPRHSGSVVASTNMEV